MSRKDDKVIINVRVQDVGSIPPKYFLHDAVIQALQDVIRSDVVVHGNPVPPGVRPIFGHHSRTLFVSNAGSLKRGVKSALQPFADFFASIWHAMTMAPIPWIVFILTIVGMIILISLEGGI